MNCKSHRKRGWAIAVLLVATMSGCGTARMPVSSTTAARQFIPPLAPIELVLIDAAVDSVTKNMDAKAAICIAVLGGPGGAVPAPAELLEHLSGERGFVGSHRCPRTYESMMVPVDSLGRRVDPPRPAGYVDPYQVTLGRPQFDSPTYAKMYVRVVQGTRGGDFICTVQLYRERASAYCESHRRWIS